MSEPIAPIHPDSLIDWRSVKIHFGKQSGTTLGSLDQRSLRWWKENWQPNARFCKGPKCMDCALRSALDAATFEPPKVVSTEATGELVGNEGDKITVKVTVESVREFTTEFNRKKVIQQSAYFVREDGARFFWKSSAMPQEIQQGAALTITGTIKEHFTNRENQRVTALKNVKVDGAVKLAPTRFITLYCDGKSSADRFAVCAADGSVLECGSCGMGRPDNGDNTDHELFAALRAFDIARRVKDCLALPCIGLTLNFDAQWMKGMVGKAKPLHDFAKQHRIVVTMNLIAGTSNPADEWTIGGGERSFDGDLASLAA